MRNEKYTCVIIRHLSADQKKQWQELWNSGKTRHIFNSPKFFTSCLEAFEHKKYAVIFCYKGGKLCGALPLVEDRVFGIKTLSCPGRKGNYMDKSALLASEYDRDIFNAMIESALSLGNLYLAELGESVKNLIDFSKSAFFMESASRSRWTKMSCEGNLFDCMPKKQKKTMLKRIRSREKDLEFRFFENDLEKAFRIVLEVEKGSYKHRRRAAFFEKKNSKKFIEAIIKNSPENARIAVLYFQKQPAATILGFVCDRTFFAYHISFLKDYQSWGAGKMALYEALEYLRKKGFSKADLLRGDTDLKRQFAKNTADQYNFYFSKNYFALFWWRMCALITSILKKVKSFIESAAFASARRKILTVFFYGKKNIFNSARQARQEDNRGKTKNNNKPIIVFSSYDNYNNPHYAGGGARAVHETAKRLVKRFEVHVLAGKYRNCPKNKVLDGVHYKYIGSCLLGPKPGQLVFHFMLQFYIITKSFDIWVESFTPPFSTSFLPLFTKKPVIGLAHMLSAEDMFRKYKIPFQFIENLGIGIYNNFIVLTEETERKIKKLNFQANVEIIPNGVNFAFSDSRPDQLSKKHFLFIGRIEINQKGLDLLLEAYKLIEKKTAYLLAIVGQGSPNEEKKLMEMIHKLGIPDRVKFLGRLEGAEKLKIFQEAATVIIPSRFETFSLAALEALAQNIPVISFDIEGLKWLPADFSDKVKPFDISCLAQKMLKAPAENNLSSANKNKLKNFLINYDWDIIAGKYGEYFNSIIKAKSKK